MREPTQVGVGCGFGVAIIPCALLAPAHGRPSISNAHIWHCHGRGADIDSGSAACPASSSCLRGGEGWRALSHTLAIA